ncbi:MAG: aminoacyl-tRNA hydrolase [Minisyncoccia bacterium]
MEINFNSIQLIIGLGNPEKKYENTYHNIGLLAINYLYQKLNLNKKKKKYFDYAEIIKDNKIIYLIFPKTYMNESGLSLKAALKEFKIKPENVLIIHDDSDLIIGNFKYSFGRGAAGHRGILSIFKALKSKNFYRLRIGIRPKNSIPGKIKAEEFVLKNIKPEDKKIFYFIFEELIKKLIEKDLPSL